MDGDIMLREQGMDLHAGLVAQHLAYFGFGQALGSVAFNG